MVQASQRRPANSELYFRAAAAAGCPLDQVKNFVKAAICLQPRQLAMSAAARECDRDGGPNEIGVGGARMGGKSAWCLAQLAADDCQRFPSLKCLFLRKVGKAAKESLEDLRRQILKGVPHAYSAHKGLLSFENGSRILTGHFSNEKDIDAYLGLEYDVIAVEEATTLTFPKYRMILSCNRTSKIGWRPRTYSTTNPGGVGHAWYRARFVLPFRAGTQTTTRFVPSLVTDNYYANADYIKILEDQVGWIKQAWRYGDWDIAAGQYFTTFSDTHHVTNEIDLTRAKSWGLALDHGFTHYTACYLGFRDGDGNFYVVDEHVERGWLVERHADAIHAMLGRHKNTIGEMDYKVAGTDIFAKESRARSVAEDYQDHGIHWKPAVTDRINGAAEILRLLGEPNGKTPKPARLKIHRRCVRLIECLPSMQHNPTRPEDVLKVDVDDDGNGGDDPYDAFRYLVAQRIQPVSMRKLGGL